MNAKGITHDKLVVCHCIVHKQNRCPQSVKFDDVAVVVTDCINFIKKRYLNSRILKQVLKDFDADYDDLSYTVLFVGRVVGICLGSMILFCQKSLSLQT